MQILDPIHKNKSYHSRSCKVGPRTGQRIVGGSKKGADEGHRCDSALLVDLDEAFQIVPLNRSTVHIFTEKTCWGLMIQGSRLPRVDGSKGGRLWSKLA